MTVHRIALAASLALFSGSCGGARATLPRAPTRTAAPSPAVASLVRPAESARAAPGLAGARGRRFLAGGARAELEGERPSFAEDLTAYALDVATEVEGGWVFLSGDGLVSASETWLGPLRSLGRAPEGARMNPWSRGRAVMVAGDALYLATARGFERAESLSGAVLSSAFASATRGAAVLRDGNVAITRDGGATWAPAPPTREVALEASFDGATLRVLTTGGWLAVAEDGSLAATSEPGGSAADQDAERERADRVTRALAEEAAGNTWSRVYLAQGTSLELQGRALLWRDAAGRVTRRGSVEEGCSLRPWGTSAALRCRRLVRYGEDGTGVVVFPPSTLEHASAMEALVLSDDGRHAAVACPVEEDEGRSGSDEDEAPTQWCVLEDGESAWRRLDAEPETEPPSTWTLKGMHGTTLLLERSSESGRQSYVRELDGPARAVHRGYEATPDGNRLLGASLTWLPDGSLASVANVCAVAGCAPRVAVGSPLEEPTVWSIPEGTTSVALYDARRALAWGSTLATVRRTLDGGETWEPLPAGESGQAPIPPLQGACDERGCTLPGVLRVEGWGPWRLQGVRRLAAGPRPHGVPSAALPSPLAPLMLRCNTAGPGGVSPWRLSGPPTDRSGMSPRGPWRLGAFVVPRGARGGSEPSLTLSWRGRGGPLRAALSAGLMGSLEEATVLWAEGAAVLQDRARFYWVSPAHTARLVGALSDVGAPLPFTEALSTGTWSVLEAGRGAIVHGVLAWQSAPLQVVTLLDASGSLVHRRVFTVPLGAGGARPWLGLAEVGGRWGRAVVLGDSARFQPLDDVTATPVALPTPREPLFPCGVDREPDAVTVHLFARDQDLVALDGRYGHARAEVELSPRATCLRSLELQSEGRLLSDVPGASARPVLARLAATADGTLEGFEDNGERRGPILCEVTTR